MAITLDAISSGGDLGGTTHTLAHTVGVGSNTALFVTGSYNGSVTYNGVALTMLKTSGEAAIWGLVAPAAGTHDIVQTTTFSTNVNLHAISLFGVDQTTMSDASGGSNSAFQDSPLSNTIAVSAGGWAIDRVTGFSGTNDFVPASGQTEIADFYTASSGGNRDASSYKAGATSMGWTWTTPSSSAAVSHAIVAVKAAGGAAAPTLRSRKLLLGVGA